MDVNFLKNRTILLNILFEYFQYFLEVLNEIDMNIYPGTQKCNIDRNMFVHNVKI